MLHTDHEGIVGPAWCSHSQVISKARSNCCASAAPSFTPISRLIAAFTS